VFLHGADGLRAVSELAALNANYLAHLVKEDFPLAHPDMRPMHEFVATAKPLREAGGVKAMDVAKRVIDLGFHPSTVYFPLVVEEAMMVEPTERRGNTRGSSERRPSPPRSDGSTRPGPHGLSSCAGNDIAG
jgi:glycine cleavage system protein P-like pyridoxal-binding family